MGDQIQQSWKQLQEAVSTTQNVSALTMSVYLVLGGLLALYLRVLYTRCSTTISDSDSVTRVFPSEVTSGCRMQQEPARNSDLVVSESSS